ncbi:uncharacterized protein RCC_08835 [Ramularia collo-cygni]|uniref:Uncharacterized protein n=1 Tax=Ramularia collo-cygni TaxID=112498 RepID=A0A2D3VBS0_9PEZI|nr:uncharacterized protein RCC_08835 [Ramularia collo-cygni]CZT23125.1 uncharacterized protein RCC_08835 [Ramularia collo-cygni]
MINNMSPHTSFLPSSINMDESITAALPLWDAPVAAWKDVFAVALPALVVGRCRSAACPRMKSHRFKSITKVSGQTFQVCHKSYLRRRRLQVYYKSYVPGLGIPDMTLQGTGEIPNPLFLGGKSDDSPAARAMMRRQSLLRTASADTTTGRMDVLRDQYQDLTTLHDHTIYFTTARPTGMTACYLLSTRGSKALGSAPTRSGLYALAWRVHSQVVRGLGNTYRSFMMSSRPSSRPSMSNIKSSHSIIVVVHHQHKQQYHHRCPTSTTLHLIITLQHQHQHQQASTSPPPSTTTPTHHGGACHKCPWVPRERQTVQCRNPASAGFLPRRQDP